MNIFHVLTVPPIFTCANPCVLGPSEEGSWAVSACQPPCSHMEGGFVNGLLCVPRLVLSSLDFTRAGLNSPKLQDVAFLQRRTLRPTCPQPLSLFLRWGMVFCRRHRPLCVELRLSVGVGLFPVQCCVFSCCEPWVQGAGGPVALLLFSNSWLATGRWCSGLLRSCQVSEVVVPPSMAASCPVCHPCHQLFSPAVLTAV